VLLAPLLLWALWMGRPAIASALEREFHWLRRLLARKGGPALPKTEYWSAQQLAQQGSVLWPQAAHEFSAWAQAMEGALYAGANEKQALAMLRRLRWRFFRLHSLKH